MTRCSLVAFVIVINLPAAAAAAAPTAHGGRRHMWQERDSFVGVSGRVRLQGGMQPDLLAIDLAYVPRQGLGGDVGVGLGIVGVHAGANLRYHPPIGRLVAPFVAVGPQIAVGGDPLSKRMIVWAGGEVGVDLRLKKGWFARASFGLLARVANSFDPPPPAGARSTGHYPSAEEYGAHRFMPSFSLAFGPVF